MAQTTPPTVDPLPSPTPATSSPSNFNSLADSFLGALQAWANQLIALAVNVYNNAVDAYNSAVQTASSASAAAGSASSASVSATAADNSRAAAVAALANVNAAATTTATSTTATTPALGTFSFAIQAGKAFQAGQSVVAVSRSRPTAFIEGTVSSYSGTSLVIAATDFGGIGAHADWDISYVHAVPLPTSRPGQVLTNDGTRVHWGDTRKRAIDSIENLHLYSHDITGVVFGTHTLNQLLAPDGIDLADMLVNAADGNPAYCVRTLPAWNGNGGIYAAGTVLTYSRYYHKKTGSNPTVQHNAYVTAEAQDYLVRLNLDTGVLTPYTYNDKPLLDYGAEQVGSTGWWRVWITFAVYASGGSAVGVYSTYVGDLVTGNGFYAWGAVAKHGYGPGPVVVTTSAIVSGAGALQANMVAGSLAVDTSAGHGWTLGTGITRYGKVTSPNGAADATAYTANGTASGVAIPVATVAGRQYTASGWFKLLSGTPAAGTVMVPNGGESGLSYSNIQTDGKWHEITYTWVALANNEDLYPFYNQSNGVRLAVWNFRMVEGPVAIAPRVNPAGVLLPGAHADIQSRSVNEIDSSKAAITLAIPVMEDGEWFDVVDVGGAAAVNNITLLLGWLPAIAGVAEDFIVDTNRWSGRFTFRYGKGLEVS